MRKKIVAANWKMNMTTAEATSFVEAFLVEARESAEVEIVLIPPFTCLGTVSDALSKAPNIKAGAQNMHWEKSGAFTGEISAAMLRDLFVRYVVLGHSERRHLFAETDEIVNRKLRAAHEAGLKPILCIGETLEQRERGDVETIIKSQLGGSLTDVGGKEIAETVIAYEPVWAIGTGKVATTEQAEEAHAFVRATLSEMVGAEVADKVRIQYGGSVKPDNAHALLHQPNIDGALVGGASLDPRSFAQIVAAAATDGSQSTA